MRRLILIACIVAVGALLWLSWQKPLRTTPALTLQHALPDEQRTSKADPARQRWRVLTHRVLSKEGIAALKKRLEAMGLHPVAIRSMEDVTMHAFDDAVIFKTSRKAHRAEKIWRKHKIETHLIRVEKGIYLLSLGRLYQVRYAELLEKDLDRVGRKYRYQKRLVPIPVVRFTFAPSDKPEAEQLWKRLNDAGVMMPSLMPENRFNERYGNDIVTHTTNE